MKIAIISDIHSNLEALTTVLGEVRRLRVDETVCLGDVVGYGPNPRECLAAVRDAGIPCIMGNHDAAAVDVGLRASFSPLAHDAIAWTAGQLAEPDLAFLGTFPYRMLRYGLTFVHASPAEPEEFHYILSIVEAIDNFASFDTPVCFLGHTHQPAVFCEDLRTRQVVKGKRFIVNVGSVGQPRDGDPRACFGVFDTETFTFEHVRLAYDVERTANKIYKAGLPHRLGDRLVLGV